MAHIIERKRKDGSTAYLAQIDIKRNGKRIHREARTFDKRSQATAWAKKRSKEISLAGDDLSKIKFKGRTVGDAIKRYVAESRKEIGNTKSQVLETIQNEYDLAGMVCSEVKSHHIVELAQQIGDRPGLDSPATVGNYLSHLAAVFDIARPAWGYPLEHQEMKDAFKVCNRLGITGKSIKRERRPTLDELDRLMSVFQQKHQHRPKTTPMHRVCAFAIFSTRRLSEITRMEWDDLDTEPDRVMIRDMKHPGDKIGNNVLCELPTPAADIAFAMPKTSRRVFPFNSDSISAAFTRTCAFLEIDDLRFHDLRHEGVSRLFEMGLTIPKVAAASGHRSWSSLQRYTHMDQVGDKYDNWKWIERVTASVKHS